MVLMALECFGKKDVFDASKYLALGERLTSLLVLLRILFRWSVKLILIYRIYCRDLRSIR